MAEIQEYQMEDYKSDPAIFQQQNDNHFSFNKPNVPQTARFEQNHDYIKEYYETKQLKPKKVIKEETKQLVQEMLRKRREERSGAQTERFSNNQKSINYPITTKNKPENPALNNVTKKLKEIDDLTQDSAYFNNNNTNLSNTNLNATQSKIMNNNLSQTMIRSTSGYIVNSPKQKITVFDRLAVDARHKLIETRMGNMSARTTSRGNANNRSMNKSTSRSRVEDRLISYQKEKEIKLAQQRAQKQALELKFMQNSPRISKASDELSRSHVGAYSSLLERFEALERAKQKKQVHQVQEKIQNELSQIRDIPEINEKSKEMIRNVKSLLSWELRKHQKVEESKMEKRMAEQVQLAQNTSLSHISQGSSKILDRIGRSGKKEKIEDSLIRYGEVSAKKRALKAKDALYPYSPRINENYKISTISNCENSVRMNASPRNTYVSLYEKAKRSQYASSQIENFPDMSIPAGKKFNENEIMQESARASLLKEAQNTIGGVAEIRPVQIRRNDMGNERQYVKEMEYKKIDMGNTRTYGNKGKTRENSKGRREPQGGYGYQRGEEFY